MKCPKCKGKTECFKEVFNDGKRRREILVECDMCHGSGEVPMTNEEYLRVANVNDMATMIATKLLELARHEYGMCDVVDRDIVLKWLKEVHND